MGLTAVFRAGWRACFALAALVVLPGTVRADSSVWPEQGGVDFQVSLGVGGMVIGQAKYSWTQDGEKYQMQLALETTGVTAVLYRLNYVQQSQGLVLPGKEGLRPLRFEVAQSGREPESAVFSWDGASGQVSIRRGARERRNLPLSPGDQDILSIWRQVGHDPDKLPESLLVVGNKNGRHVQIVKLEDAVLQVPAGRFETRHVSARSDDGQFKIDLWLAGDHCMVPVRAILGDAKTETLTLEATSLRLPTVTK